MSAPTVIVLAAGQGSRMKSSLAKVLHPICGRPMVLWPVLAAQQAGARKVVVVGGPDRALGTVLPEGVELAVQDEPLGTGHAVKAAAAHIDPGAPVLILMGDVPLLTSEAIKDLLNAHGEAQATMATMILDDPTGYGRVVRNPDGAVDRVVETKADGDATPEQLAINEVNSGVFVFAGGPLLEALEKIGAANAQGEEYLPDVLPHLRPVQAHVVEDPTLMLGVNDRVDLAKATALAQRRIVDALARDGVTFIDPGSTTVDAGVTLGRDTVVEPGCSLRGSSASGEGATIGPHTTLLDTTLGNGAVVRHSLCDHAQIGDRVSVGPFAYLRPGAVLRAGAKAGTFVEIKNSDIGEGAKVPHLSYIGDADVGPGTNLGAATITANYDGATKHRTTIGEGVRTSVDTTLVAPVTLGDGSFTAAGSVITGDVPPGALGVARARQKNVEGYADRRRDPSDGDR